MGIFGITQVEPRTFIRVAVARDPIVTEYVRARLQAILSAKEMTQLEIAARVGVSPAFVSNLVSDTVASRTGIAGRSIEKFAAFLGHENGAAMREHAYELRRQSAEKASPRASEPVVQEALDFVKSVHAGIADWYWDRVLARFGHPDFAGRSRDFWITALGLEAAQYLHLTRANLAGDAATLEARERAREHGQRGRRKQIEGEFRTKARAKRAAAQAESVAEAGRGADELAGVVEGSAAPANALRSRRATRRT